MMWSLLYILFIASAFPGSTVLSQTNNNEDALHLYNRPDCPLWPSRDVWFDELAPLLSPEALLHGPTTTYENTCDDLGYLDRLDQGNGVCLVAREDCQYQFCDAANGVPNIPAYSVEAWTVCDIQVALQFASKYNIPVTVKSSGHSQIGQSTAKDSLLIWLAHFPVDDNIVSDYADTCGTQHGSIVRINGGEGFDSVLSNAVRDEYHIVTGSDWTVSSSGGWLQGGGLSWSSRRYGLGIDQVVAYDVVLTDSGTVRADACTNPDLFWALRGGAGGTFGVVTKAYYKLHPKQSVVTLYWILDGQDYLRDNDRYDDLYNFAELFLRFWIEQSPYLDERWGGFWSAYGVGLFFWGPKEEARRTFVEVFDQWYDTVLLPNTSFDSNWGVQRPSETLSDEWPSWYEFRTSRNNFVDNGIGNENLSFQADGQEFSRLIPRDAVIQRPDGALDMLMDLERNGALHPRNYVLGGFINQIPSDATAINPAMRKAVWSIYGRADYDGSRRMREFVSNDETGACYNHHGPWEPEWRTALWGSNYDRLLSIKDRYDPRRLLNCWHCVGYVGKEFGDDMYIEPPCPTSTSSTSPLPSEQCESNGFIICVRKTIITCLEHCGSPDLVRVLEFVGWRRGRCPSGTGLSF